MTDAELLTLDEAALEIGCDKHDIYRLRKRWDPEAPEAGLGVHDVVPEGAARNQPRITRSSVEALLRRRERGKTYEGVEERIGAIESFVDRWRRAENDTLPFAKAEIERLRELVEQERVARVKAERISLTIAQRLLDLGVDVGELRAAQAADRPTLELYSEWLTTLVVPDTATSTRDT